MVRVAVPFGLVAVKMMAYVPAGVPTTGGGGGGPLPPPPQPTAITAIRTAPVPKIGTSFPRRFGLVRIFKFQKLQAVIVAIESNPSQNHGFSFCGAGAVTIKARAVVAMVMV